MIKNHISRGWIAFAAVSLTAVGCASATNSSGGGVEVVGPAPCVPSDIAEVRLVQGSAIFDSAAKAVSAFTFRDSAAARSGVEWICSQLQAHDIPGVPTIRLVSGPAYYSAHRVDIVFAVYGANVVLLSPWIEGRPVGGLNPEIWNRFVLAASVVRVFKADEARSLACALHHVQQRPYSGAVCWAEEVESQRQEGTAWVVAFRADPPDPAIDFRLARDGTLIRQVNRR